MVLFLHVAPAAGGVALLGLSADIAYRDEQQYMLQQPRTANQYECQTSRALAELQTRTARLLGSRAAVAWLQYSATSAMVFNTQRRIT
jgi:hypothetical protein